MKFSDNLKRFKIKPVPKNKNLSKYNQKPNRKSTTAQLNIKVGNWLYHLTAISTGCKVVDHPFYNFKTFSVRVMSS